MSKQATKRANAINKDFESLEKTAASVVSNLVAQTSVAKLLIVFLHDNLLNSKGDLSEGDRVDTRNALVPLYTQIQGSLVEMESLFNIYDVDLAVWQSNLDSYLAANPSVLGEALERFPKVG
tara:strand:- start:1053 stop:1418 length:366 start_codon:yes stop_codon:yes gene_type:complete